MEWVNLVISSHKSYEYEAQWHGGGIYGGYVETDPRPLLIVCSFNIENGAFNFELTEKQ